MLNSNERIIKHKVGLLNLAEELGNVSQACKVMGMSRETFYRYKAAVEGGGHSASGQLRTRNELRKLGVFRLPQRGCSGIVNLAAPLQGRLCQALHDQDAHHLS